MPRAFGSRRESSHRIVAVATCRGHPLAMTSAIDTREGGIVWMQVDPRLDKLRDDAALHAAFQRLAW